MELPTVWLCAYTDIYLQICMFGYENLDPPNINLGKRSYGCRWILPSSNRNPMKI